MCSPFNGAYLGGLIVFQRKNRQRNLFILCFLLPPLILYGVLYIWPFLYAFIISMFKWSGYSAEMTYCGFDNYASAFRDPIVWQALKNNLFFLVFCTAVTLVLSMFFAVCFTRLKMKHSGFFRIVYFFPNTLSIIVVSVLWKFIYNPQFGLLKGILETIGLGSWVVNWLGKKEYVMGALVAPQAWMYIGFYMVLFIGAIHNIPEDYYESSMLDGAGQFRQFFSITLPLIWGTFRIALVHLIVNAFEKTYSIVRLVTDGGPGHASEVMTTYLYNNAFKYGKFGYGSTIGVLLFAIVAVISLTVYRITKRDAIEF
jgi:N-acetylglucosamine transport system permease protein